METKESDLITTPLSVLANLFSHLESLWQGFDELFAGMDPGDWANKHGKHWTCADVPYHLACFDKDWIANGLEQRTNINPDLLQPLCTLNKLNAWNDARLAQRPAQQTPAESVAQMHASQDAIRQSMKNLLHTDLERHVVWLTLPYTGWSTVTETLEACYYHAWNHFMELRLRLKRSTPDPGPDLNHRALAFLLTSFAKCVDRTQAARTTLSIVMEFGGPGGGAWTLEIANGGCSVTEERRKQPDLFMWVENAETLVKLMAGTHNPLLILAGGKVKVQGWSKIPAFIKLFHPPKNHQLIEYNSIPAFS